MSNPPVTWHDTPSDVRALRNFLALMKRGGLYKKLYELQFKI